MKKLLAVVALVALLVAQAFRPAVVAQTQGAAALPSFAEPGISPDGATIAFVSGGDIWEVPARGGDARLLVSHPATESRPLFSPDGKRLAFTSTRTGNGDVYVLTLASGDVTRLTFDDANELVCGWSADGQSVLFQSSSHEISGMLDVYRVGVDGGTPMPVAADRYTTEYFGAPAPSGDAVAITARANAGSQWWRKGHSHLDESEIWIVRPAAVGAGLQAGPSYEQVTRGGAKDAWPMWGGDSKTLYFMSDRSGAQNIWVQGAAVPGSGAKAVTTFKDGRVLWPSISKDGKTIAFERDFGIWTVDTASGQAREVPIALRGAPAATSVEHRTFSDQLQELALSPDGKKAAFTVHGEIFSVSAKDGGDAARVTQTAEEEGEIVWAPNSRQLAYVSDRLPTEASAKAGSGTNHLFVYDFATGKETQLTTGAGRDDVPRYSPDGKWIAFERNSKELRLIDPATKEEKLLASGVFDTPPFADSRDFVWSPDSRFVAYLDAGIKAFQNVHVVPAAGGEARAVSFLANSNAGSLSWSPDGTYLTFTTSQRTEPGEVMRIDLLPRTPKFREDQFRDLFREETPKTPAEPVSPPAPPAGPALPALAGAKRPVEIVYDEIRRRASALPVGVTSRGRRSAPTANGCC
jgi:tricorn protease